MNRKSALALATALLLATPAAATAAPTDSPGTGTGAGAGSGKKDAAAAAPVSTDVATRGEAAPQYRIPGLTTTTEGTIIAAYDARPTVADLPSDIAIVIRRSTDNGATWQEQRVVRDEAAPKGFGDPSLITDRETGRIFVFYASGVNTGFASSHTGNDENDPDILQTDYSWSDDDGLTWKHERITADIKDPSWGGIFAASGEGIQLRHGPHAGRLIQQYVIRKDGQNYAASAYSDDHGDTWRTGELVGPNADENKTVELSDGTVMLNNRKAPYRTVARSTDGGVTYTPLVEDTQLPDPADNASIVRYAPDAPASDPRSKWLLFSNNDDSALRRNLTVRMSCDDGKTWPIRRTLAPGAAAYSTLTPLPDGRMGLLWERAGYQHVTYTSFGLDWLEGLCAPVTVTPPSSVQAGTTAELTVRVVNQTQSRLPASPVRMTLPQGWSAGTVTAPALAPGQGANIKVPVSVARSAPGVGTPVTATYTVGGKQSSGTARLAVTADATAPAAPSISMLPVLDHYDAGGAAGITGDVMTYNIRVTNTGNTKLDDVTLTGNVDNLAACHWSSLPAGASYTCRGTTAARHTVTEADVTAGGFTPELSLSAATPAGTRITTTATGEHSRF